MNTPRNTVRLLALMVVVIGTVSRAAAAPNTDEAAAATPPTETCAKPKVQERVRY